MKNFKKEINLEKNYVELTIDSNIYSLETVYAATYAFLDKAYVILDGDPEEEIIIKLKAKKDKNKEELERVAGEFLNELINSGLRLKIAKRNKKTKEYIMSAALIGASAEVQEKIKKNNDSEDDDSHNDDPLGIAQSWEEAYGEEDNKK